MAQFNVGDKAVIPKHGVGIVTSLVTELIDGREYKMYVLKVLHDGSNYKVPVANADAKGLREIIPPEAVDKVYEVLRDRSTPADKQTWNRRYREYTQKIDTGDPLEVAGVLRDLALLKADKQLSFGERNMYDKANSLIVQELAFAKDVDEGAIKKELEGIFAA